MLRRLTSFTSTTWFVSHSDERHEILPSGRDLPVFRVLPRLVGLFALLALGFTQLANAPLVG